MRDTGNKFGHAEGTAFYAHHKPMMLFIEKKFKFFLASSRHSLSCRFDQHQSNNLAKSDMITPFLMSGTPVVSQSMQVLNEIK